MALNFIGCDRDQELLLPPSVRDWLPEDHFTWFVLAAVEEMDLASFYATSAFTQPETGTPPPLQASPLSDSNR